MKKNLQKGFTLIELLVVVAIIGILASVVLASLNTARSKGADAAIKANLDNMRAEAAIFYDNQNSTYALGTYAGTAAVPTAQGVVAAASACETTFLANTVTNYNLMGDQTFFNGVNQAFSQSGSGTAGNCSYINSASVYAVAMVLKSDTAGTTAWCVDSTGQSKSEAVTANTASGAFNASLACK